MIGITEHELMALVYIQAQIDKLTERIAELEEEDGVGAVNIDGMPHGSTPGNPVERIALAKATLHSRLLRLKAERVEKEIAIREYIDTVEKHDIQLIMEWRFIDLLDWFAIADEWEAISGKRLDRTTLAKRLKNYLDNREK